MAEDKQHMETKKQVGTLPLASNLKLLQLLEVLAETTEKFGVSEVARKVGLSRSMVHRQLVTLASAGWLTSDTQGQYQLTFTPVRLGQAALRHSSIDDRVNKELNSLADRLGEGVSLGTLDEGYVLIVGRGIPSRNVQVSLAHGQRFKINSSALGHVLSRYLTNTEYQTFKQEGVLLPSSSVCLETREKGYATWIDSEFDPIEVLATPVGRAQGNVRYALSAHWPQGRAKPQAVLPILEEGSRTLEDLLKRSPGIDPN